MGAVPPSFDRRPVYVRPTDNRPAGRAGCRDGEIPQLREFAMAACPHDGIVNRLADSAIFA